MAVTQQIKTIVSPFYSQVLSRFPQNFSFCFAYGSAVKKQLVTDGKPNMIDLMFCVDDPKDWHKANMRDNFSHYSLLKYFGPRLVSKVQKDFGAKVYFNTLVRFEGSTFKYGVISTRDLVTDLLEWSHLYVAGRLHKPVEVLRAPSNPELQTALQLNLQSAVHAALLLMPYSFSEYEFYCAVSNLSYAGDFRMTFGENRNKIKNIVKPQLISFRKLYKPYIDVLQEHYVVFPVSDLEDPVPVICYQDLSPTAKLHHLNLLPRWPQTYLSRFWNGPHMQQDTEDVLRAIAYDRDCKDVVQEIITNLVWKSSVSQSMKGIVTAGLLKSIRYSSRKIRKMFSS